MITSGRPADTPPPPADTAPDDVLWALIRTGRWRDAAEYVRSVPDARLLEHAQLLLAAGHIAEAHAVLSELDSEEDAPPAWRHFVSAVDATLRGDRGTVAELVGAAGQLPADPLVALLMVRAAEHTGAYDVAVHYAQQLFDFVPGDVDVARVLSVDLLRRGEYGSAVKVLDIAERAKGADQPSPLDATLAHLTAAERTGDVTALVTVGRFVHREKDPTQPVTEQERAARARWRAAYRRYGPRRGTANLARLAVLAVGVAVSVLIGNAAPTLLLVVGIGLWVRQRPLPGMDLRTSRIVRAATDPMQALRTRHYRAIDVLTLIWVLVVGCGLAVQLPNHPSWLAPAGLVAAGVLSLAAVRARRRWVRRRRQQLRPPPTDPTSCICLDVNLLRDAHAGAYIDQHLFRVGTAPAAPRWPLLQCLTTYTRFLRLPDAEVAVRLPTVSDATQGH